MWERNKYMNINVISHDADRYGSYVYMYKCELVFDQCDFEACRMIRCAQCVTRNTPV